MLRLLSMAIVLPAFLLASLAIPADARVRVKEKVTHYTVSGKTGERMWRQIAKRGPNVNGGHAIASTTIQSKLGKIKYVVKGSKCRISSVDLSLSLTYRYPRWSRLKSAKASSRKVWNKFYKQLVRHEKAHGKIEKDFSRSVERELLRATGRVSRQCKDFAVKLTKRVNRLRKRADQAHQRLDRRDGYSSSRLRRYQRQTFRIN